MHYNDHMEKENRNSQAGPKIGQMKRTYFFAVVGVYLLSFAVLYGVSQVFLTIFPVHPYIELAVNLLLMAASVSVTKYIVDIEMKDRWLRR